MEFTDFLITKIEWLIGLGGSLVMFFVGKQSRKITDESGELDNLDKFREIAKKMVDDQIFASEKLRELIKEKDVIIENQSKIIKEQEKTLNKYSKKYGFLND